MNRIAKNSTLLPKIDRGIPFLIEVDGKQITAYQGETVAAVLSAANITTFRKTKNKLEERGLYCGMGVCYECLVTINGIHAQRACITPVEKGMIIETCQELQI